MSIPREQLDETLTLLARQFPQCFFVPERERIPLQLGIRGDILKRLGDRIDRKLLKKTLQRYTDNIHYRMAQQPGVPRIALDGSVCGTVSEADANSAAKDVARREAAAAIAPPPSPPKRLSLADLREAAQRRKAAGADGDQSLDRAGAPVPSL
jgi:sRNA-binding protein